MPRDDDKSLGDQNTFDGEVPSSNRGPQSLGDEATFGGDTGTIDDAFDDGMEVVDLAARYTTEGTLGKGGMGEVLLATDTRLNRKVAIKRILGSAARSKTAVSRFLTEAQSIAALNHPNIVQIHDYGRAEDGPFLIMEYVEGSSLLNKRQAAAYTSLSERTLERLAASGELQGRRIGSRIIRYRKQDIEVWIEGLESGRKGR